MERLGKIAMWFLTVIMVVLCLAYFPSITSVLAILFVLLAIPIEPIQDFWFMHDVDGWKKGVLLAVLFIVSAAVAPTDSTKEPDKNDSTSRPPVTEKQEESKEPEQEPEVIPVIEAVPKVDIDTSDYMKIDSEVLFEYGGYLSGENVVTVITVANVGTNSVKAHTENNDSFFFSVVCYFDGDVPSGIEEGDVLTIAGTMEERSEILETLSFLETPTATIENCSIIGHGEIAQELKDGAAAQREVGEQAKQAYEAEVAAARKAEKDEYISQCQTVKYSDVERNPDTYDGMKIKVSGTVVQVAEGWFDSVTLRVSSGGNMWYVTYSREEGESRILENDNITCYGECDGVRSYTTVLGAQKTIPSLKMEYYS